MIFRSSVVAFWIVLIGLACVTLEVARVRVGNRIHCGLNTIDEIEEQLRELEVEYNRLACPDALESDLARFLQSRDESVRFQL